MEIDVRKHSWKEGGVQVPAALLLVLGFLSVFGVISCGGTGAGSRRSEEERGCVDLLDIADPRERHLGLLRRHLEMPQEVCPMVYLAREDLEAGRLDEARLYLEAVADDWKEGSDEELLSCYRLGYYLTAYLNFLDGEYASALENLGVIESIGASEEACRGGAEAQSTLNGKEKLLKARIFTAMDLHDDEAAGLLLELWEDDREMLGDAGTLMLVHSLIEQRMDDRAAEILLFRLSEAPYSGGNAALWAELCRRAVLPEYTELTLAEFLIIEGLEAEIESAADSASEAAGPGGRMRDERSPAEILRAEEIVKLVQGGSWNALLSILKELDEGKSHRFSRYLNVLCRLNDKDAGPEELAEYQEAGAPYRGTQIYYSFLWKAANGMGSRYRALCEEALTVCIQTGPHSKQALEARRQLALLYGAPDDADLLPLTAAEMEELAGFVIEGAPAGILLPMVGFLEWPENRCSLHASLILRQLREVPGVRKLLSEQMSQSNQRGKERIEAILSM
ncbi:MAG: hypothetical protein ACP5IA_02510 [Sediminispirochaetaceae bacterium]